MPSNVKVSIIIPTLNEAEHIERLVKRLLEGGDGQIADLIVVDGGSTDDTVAKAQGEGANVLCASRTGRATQMNFGARQSAGELLYFVHADTLPPCNYMQALQDAVAQGFEIGSFRLCLDSDSPFLRINSFMTRFPFLWCRGGDQTLFITRRLFDALGGYREDYSIMEEYDLIIRARKHCTFKIIPHDVLASPRKYVANSYLRVQFAHLVVFNMFRFGYSQEKIMKAYQTLLNCR